jgi:hypothetical protein
MAGDIKIKYGSTGFEKAKKELREMEMIGATSGDWFKSTQKSLKEVGSAHENFTKTFTAGLQTVASAAGSVAMSIVKIGTVVTAVSGIVAGVGVAAFTKWSVSVLKTTETFRMLETSLYGATKSWESVNKVSEFAKKYAAEYPAMYKDIMQAMQSFAYIPALKPMIMKGDVEEMHKMMTIVQGMMTMRPEQGVSGAIYALREAMAGNWRSLQMRFDIPIASIAKSAGMSMEEMRRSPAEAVKALKSFIDEFVGADTMAMMAKNLSIQIGNLKDKYEMWLDKLGKTGVYQKVVDYLIKLNNVQERFMASERFQKWTEQINKFLEDVVDRIAGIFTKGIDWESIATMGQLGEALKQVGRNAIEELKKVWEAAKEPLAEALKGVFKFVGSAAAEAFKEAVLPALKEIAKQVPEMSKAAMKEAPISTMGTAFLTGAALTPGGPVPKLIGGTVAAEAVALPTQIETAKSLWRSYDDFMGDIERKIIKASKNMLGIAEEAKIQSVGVEKLTEAPRENLEGTWKTLGEIKGMLNLPEIKNVGFRKAFGLEALPETPERVADKRAEEMKRWMARPFKGWTGPWGEQESLKEAAVWKPKAPSELEYYSSWAKMAKAMAEREEGERPTPFEAEGLRMKEFRAVREKWEYGQVSTEDWRRYIQKYDAETTKRMRMEDYGKEREQKLSSILEKAIAEKEVGVQGRVYGEMFNIAYQKGDFGKAQEYMNKSLDTMLEQLKKSEKFEEEDNKNLGEIAKTSGETAEILKSWKIGEGRYSNIPTAERDELVEAVRMATGES